MLLILLTFVPFKGYFIIILGGFVFFLFFKLDEQYPNI